MGWATIIFSGSKKEKRKMMKKVENGRKLIEESRRLQWEKKKKNFALQSAKHCPFRLKFQRNTLLNTRNIHTMSDFVFNGWTVKYVVEDFNPKNLIKCHFLEEKKL